MEDNQLDNSSILKIKRKRETHFKRINSLIYIPNEYKKKFTETFFEDNLNHALLLEKKKTKQAPSINSLNNNNAYRNPKENFSKTEEIFLTSKTHQNSPKMILNNNTVKQFDERIPIIKEEIEEIVNEIEIFEITNRKKRMIHIMEQITNCLDEDLIDVDEMMDFYFYGDKVNAIEKEFLECEKRKYRNNYKLCEYTNKLLDDDNEDYQENKKENENTFLIDRPSSKKKASEIQDRSGNRL